MWNENRKCDFGMISYRLSLCERSEQIIWYILTIEESYYDIRTNFSCTKCHEIISQVLTPRQWRLISYLNGSFVGHHKLFEWPSIDQRPFDLLSRFSYKTATIFIANFLMFRWFMEWNAKSFVCCWAYCNLVQFLPKPNSLHSKSLRNAIALTCAILNGCKIILTYFGGNGNTVNLLNPIAVSFMLFMFGTLFFRNRTETNNEAKW